jgi:glycosyltransferase involved in cell wall biosynthesis
MSKSVILHISADYRDRLNPKKTTAINALIDETPDFDHVLYSLHRVNGWRGITSFPLEGEGARTALIYKALPKGILWGTRLNELANWILADLKARNIRPDVVEAHKFTVEGVIGLKLAKHFGVPLICDIQGNSDCSILHRKRALRGVYKEIAGYASLVFSYAPWATRPFVDIVGLDEGKCINLPVMPLHDFMHKSPMSKHHNLVSVFNLDAWQAKNLPGMVQAVQKLTTRYDDITLDVIGAGRPKTILDIRAMITGLGMQNHVRLIGAIPNADLPAKLKTYAGFVMPSLAESYGLVYAEALLSGLPILFSKDRGIDGYFEAENIGYACVPRDVGDIATGMAHLLDNQKALKTSVGKMQKNGALEIIRKKTVLKTYIDGINEVLK